MTPEPTHLDGYRAATLELRDLINEASRELDGPNANNHYNRGFFVGLVTASALLALGELPQSNAGRIRRILKKT